MLKKFFLFFPIKIVLFTLFLPFSNIVLAVNKNESLSNNNNPFLRSGDIIYVTKGPLGYTTEILKDLSAPFLSRFAFTDIF